MNCSPEGQTKLLSLRRHADGLCEQLEESRKPEVQRLLSDTEQQWRTVLQNATQAQRQNLSDDFDAQTTDTQFWIRDQQQKLQSVGSHTPPEERCRTAQVSLTSHYC